MSWSSPVRVLGVCGLFLAIQTGCGGNPEVEGGSSGQTGGGGLGGMGNSGFGANGGGIVIPMGGDGAESGGDDGEGETHFVCGNKELEPGEFCDDGNTQDGDGCSGDCTDVDLDYDCSAVGEPCVKVVNCGNGILEGAELCDDMNLDAGDGCSADCNTVEDGWKCVRPGAPCVAVSVCGNGMRERGEECDDGHDPASNDGCDDQCQIEPDYYCLNPGEFCVQQVCGDGSRTPNEACDDDNTTDNDGCSALCVVEDGWRCNSNGCLPVCGDALVKGTEECDDGDRDSGDGCSGACTEEPFFNCTGQPSTCVTTISCGNSLVEPGEICDPPGTNGCKAGCKSFNPDTSNPATCGNSIIEETETCDPPAVGSGCTAACAVENGWTCPQAGVCFRNPFCGDSVVQAGETCDPPKVGMGCGATCQEEAGWTCVGLGPSTCVKPVCGNSVVEPGEECDDGSATAAQDGCPNTCLIGNGWACPTQGLPCIAKCGDGIKLTSEQCDDHNLVSGDGCNKGCKVEPGFKCPTPNMSCVASACGDGTLDVGEGCEDSPGNLVAGDGCGPTCQPEPTVTVGSDPTVNVSCGDGLVTGTDECDDGNDDNGDGCNDQCEIEDGWDCSGKTVLPSSLQIKVTYRDFKSAAAAGGHPDFMYDDLGHVADITGGVCTSTTAASTDHKLCGRLDAQGKPELIKTGLQSTTGIRDVDSFKMWYRDGNPPSPPAPAPATPKTAGYFGDILTQTISSTLTLTQDTNAAYGGLLSEVYVFDAGGNNFYPINGQGLGNIGGEGIACGNNGTRNYVDDTLPAMNKGCHCDGGGCINKNYGFTTELRYFFQYKGGERLTFSGDDDVWVYVNGRIAVDIGGLHPQRNGQVVLGDDGNGPNAEDSNCSAHTTNTTPPDPGTALVPLCLTTAERDDDTDDRFGLTIGGVYEIALFHAERHVDGSNFKLTLAGFLAPRSFCDPTCGDSVITGDEVCDDGLMNSDTIAGRCNTTCTARAYCGDGVKQTGEDCDNGKNIDLYKTAASPSTVCAPGCRVPASCGDGQLQPSKEQCDKGGQNNDASYGPTSCKTNCTLGGYCGDNVQNGNETCDHGATNGKEYGANSCGYNCQHGPECGDDIRNGSEECDEGADNGTAVSHCDTDCTLKKYCGDGVKDSGEVCDYGQFASNNYGGCTDMCMAGPGCGDGTPDLPYEECDLGAALNTGGYDGCTNKCDLGPHCGDGVTQPGGGEACDNGFNDDDYKYEDMSCGVNCTPPPYCGDATVQPANELCDNGTLQNNDETYGGCSSSCDFGPFCGDGTIDGQGGEVCDDGLDNVGYQPAEGGCSYDCQPAPYCGDGTRNGPEQCDMGVAENTGEYGGCNDDCTFAPRCGDGEKQGAEQCDDGPAGSLSCTPTCKRRVVVQ